MNAHIPDGGNEVFDDEVIVDALREPTPEWLQGMVSGIAGNDVMELNHPNDVDSLREIPEIADLIPRQVQFVLLLDERYQPSGQRTLRN